MWAGQEPCGGVGCFWKEMGEPMPEGRLGWHYQSLWVLTCHLLPGIFQSFFFCFSSAGPPLTLKPWVCLEKPLHPPTHPSFLEIAVVGCEAGSWATEE